MTVQNIPLQQTNWPVGSGLACLGLAVAYQLVCAFQPIEFLNQHVLLMDDAYYYFQVARNVSLKGWVTFDGVHATSGVQLLWTIVLSGVALLWNGRMHFYVECLF